MAASLSGVYNLQNFTDLGALAAGYRLYTYAAGTTTQKTAYTDQAGTVPHTYTSDGGGGLYIALNSRGELPAPLFLTSGGYDIALKTPAGSTVWTRRAIASADVGTDVLTQLADGTSATAGAALLAYNPAKSYASGIGQFLNYQYARTAAEIAASVTPTNYAYVPGDARRYGAAIDGTTDDTVAVKNAIQCAPDGGQAIFPPGTYKVTTVDATPQGSITLWAFGARFVNTAQVATLGTPILRIRGSASKDITVIGLQVSGPRLTSSTTVGTGVYASNGYPSGIDIYTARRAVLYMCKADGTYFAGIEAHYCTDLHVEKCRSENHGYAGILFSDCSTAVAAGNRVDDVGSTMVTDGYGITASTSYNSPTYTTPNGTVVMRDNYVTRAKRKCFDVHDGLDAKVVNNTGKGFGYAGVYAVCEGTDKQVRDVLISGNKLYGDTVFVASAASQAIVVGNFGASVALEPSISVVDNLVSGVSCAGLVGVGNNTTSPQKDVRSVVIARNKAVDCAFTYGVQFNNYTPGRYQNVQIEGNQFIASPCATGWMLLPYCDSLLVSGNSITGTATSSLIDYTNSSTKAQVFDNFVNGNLVGAARSLRYTDGELIETTLSLGGSLSNVNLLSADLGVTADNSVAVQVDVLEIKGATGGICAFSYTAYGTRTGTGTPSWTPAAATNMTAGTVTIGAATAPKLIWNVVGNVGTLQFQPQDTFAAYIIKARVCSWRGTVTELAR